MFFAENDYWWKDEVEQDFSDPLVDVDDGFDIARSDQDNTVLNVSTFRCGLIPRNIHNDNDDPDTTRTHYGNSTASSSMPINNSVELNRYETIFVDKKTIKKDYLCPQCPKAYSYVRSLRRHLKYECGKECKFGCPYCNQKGHLLEHIQRHVRSRHKGRRVYAHELY